MKNFQSPLQLKAFAGTNIFALHAEASDIAKKLNTTVIFKFNGVDVTVNSITTYEQCVQHIEREFQKLRESSNT
jgi:hypothetical protein